MRTWAANNAGCLFVSSMIPSVLLSHHPSCLVLAAALAPPLPPPSNFEASAASSVSSSYSAHSRSTSAAGPCVVAPGGTAAPAAVEKPLKSIASPVLLLLPAAMILNVACYCLREQPCSSCCSRCCSRCHSCSHSRYRSHRCSRCSHGSCCCFDPNSSAFLSRADRKLGVG